MKFKDLCVALSNNRLAELNKSDAIIALRRAELNLKQQRDGLNKCIFGRKRYGSGRVCKYSEGASETTRSKPGPWYELIESDRVISKLDNVNMLHEKVSALKKQLRVGD